MRSFKIFRTIFANTLQKRRKKEKLFHKVGYESSGKIFRNLSLKNLHLDLANRINIPYKIYNRDSPVVGNRAP